MYITSQECRQKETRQRQKARERDKTETERPGKKTRQRQKAKERDKTKTESLGKRQERDRKPRERDKTRDAQETRENPGRIKKKIDSEREKGEEHERWSTKNETEKKGYKDRGKREKYRARAEKKCKIK
jgi:hypothetical protein